MTKKEKKAPPQGKIETVVKPLQAFIKKHNITIPSDDDFNLIEFLMVLGSKTFSLVPTFLTLERKARTLGNDSEQWGGCPGCGSVIVLEDCKTCPYCDQDLHDGEEASSSKDDEEDEDEADEEEDEEEVESDDDEDGDSEEEEESDDDEEESDEEEEEVEEDEDEEEEEEKPAPKKRGRPPKNQEKAAPAAKKGKKSKSDEDEDEELEDEDLEEEEDEEVEEEEDEEVEEDDDDEAEPLSGTKKGKAKPGSKKEKNAQREEARAEVLKQLPAFAKDPSKLDELVYQKLLLVAGSLGAKKPMSIGDQAALKKWIIKALGEKFPKGGGKEAAKPAKAAEPVKKASASKTEEPPAKKKLKKK